MKKSLFSESGEEGFFGQKFGDPSELFHEKHRVSQSKSSVKLRDSFAKLRETKKWITPKCLKNNPLHRVENLFPQSFGFDIANELIFAPVLLFQITYQERWRD